MTKSTEQRLLDLELKHHQVIGILIAVYGALIQLKRSNDPTREDKLNEEIAEISNQLHKIIEGDDK